MGRGGEKLERSNQTWSCCKTHSLLKDSIEKDVALILVFSGSLEAIYFYTDLDIEFFSHQTGCKLQTIMWLGWGYVLMKITRGQDILLLVKIIHPKSGSPGSPDSANYLNFPQNFSLRTRKLPTLLCWILSQGAKSVKRCQSVVEKAIYV